MECTLDNIWQLSEEKIISVFKNGSSATVYSCSVNGTSNLTAIRPFMIIFSNKFLIVIPPM